MEVSSIDQQAAMSACAPVIAKYCEDDSMKAVYKYVQEARKSLGFDSYVGMEDYMVCSAKVSSLSKRMKVMMRRTVVAEFGTAAR